MFKIGNMLIWIRIDKEKHHLEGFNSIEVYIICIPKRKSKGKCYPHLHLFNPTGINRVSWII